jgi:YbbR domain-containing protein
MKIRSIFDNLTIKLICLLLAIVMWLYANKLTGSWWPFQGQIQQSEITFRDVPVKLTGIQNEWEASPQEVEIKCLATEVEIGNLRIVVDLTREDEEKRMVTLAAKNVKLPEGLEFVRAKPSKLQIIPLH